MKKKTPNWGLIFLFDKYLYYGLNIIKYDELGWASLLPDSHKEPDKVGCVVERLSKMIELVLLLLMNNDPDIIVLPVTSKDQLTECEPVKYLKLLSNSFIVKAEPFPSEPVLNVNAILFYFFNFIINIKKNLQGILFLHIGY